MLKHYEAELRDFTESKQLSLFSEINYIVNIIPTKNVAVEIIFDKYFNQQPPFGEARRKNLSFQMRLQSQHWRNGVVIIIKICTLLAMTAI
ncbi:hypothetical protein GTQ43_38935 [Nostoc sp. KVJ3]|uniref:hypothetical protein n=1 Tax=Nostoc sp. KVJ3 TaxID=457945 RepID=UPI002237A79C|nr:hypothetical protein [Nostoc sp. KVJ3]MCW5319335.1 hypothetical protein [Nostoc sp. KVJ3]